MKYEKITCWFGDVPRLCLTMHFARLHPPIVLPLAIHSPTPPPRHALHLHQLPDVMEMWTWVTGNKLLLNSRGAVPACRPRAKQTAGSVIFAFNINSNWSNFRVGRLGVARTNAPGCPEESPCIGLSTEEYFSRRQLRGLPAWGFTIENYASAQLHVTQLGGVHGKSH